VHQAIFLWLNNWDDKSAGRAGRSQQHLFNQITIAEAAAGKEIIVVRLPVAMLDDQAEAVRREEVE
jgi:hypothetical protein